MKFDTGGLRRHGIIYSLDTGRLMGDPFNSEARFFCCLRAARIPSRPTPINPRDAGSGTAASDTPSRSATGGRGLGPPTARNERISVTGVFPNPGAVNVTEAWFQPLNPWLRMDKSMVVRPGADIELVRSTLSRVTCHPLCVAPKTPVLSPY